MGESLFQHGVVAPDETYNAIRDNKTTEEERTRSVLEEMWRKYQPYADSDFRRQIQCDFAARFWEMYLACTLLDNGVPVSSRPSRSNRGPDILASEAGGAVWIEAITPKPGAEENPDRVPEVRRGVVQEVPKDRILLRYRAAIEEKYRKYRTYRENGVVGPGDHYVIAIDCCRIPNAIRDVDHKGKHPYILEVLFPMERVWELSPAGAREDYRYQDGIDRASGTRIGKDVFVNPDYADLSAIIFAYVSSGRMPPRPGENFVLVHNPLASHALSPGFLKVGCEYVPSQRAGRCVLSRTDWP